MTPFERVMAKVRIDASGCWIFEGSVRGKGYGYVVASYTKGRPDARLVVHRVTYEHFVGPIPKGLTIDHLCRVKTCVNPDHLEAVTDAVNILRSDCPPAINARKTHCKRGHEFTPENTRICDGRRRRCRTCENEQRRAKTVRRAS